MAITLVTGTKLNLLAKITEAKHIWQKRSGEKGIYLKNNTSQILPKHQTPQGILQST